MSYIEDTERLISKWLDNSQTIDFQTSGSTSKPKTITAQKIHLSSSAERTLRHFFISEGTILNCLSTKHIAGAMQVIRSLVGNLKLHNLEPKKDPFEGQVINWKEIQLLSLVPYQLEYLIETYQHDLKQCKVILLGGAPPSNNLINKALELNFTNIFETYGMTETLSHIAVKNLTQEQNFHILDGVSIETDNSNRLIISDKKLEIQNLTTNDIVEKIDDKHFKWKGRIDFVINSGGIKLHPEEIERKLSKIIKNNDFYLYGKEHPTLGQSLALVIESENQLVDIEKELSETEIITKYEKPKEITYQKKFTRTETGKIIRNKNPFIS
jgi:O-succinylbenzoic acid--CoA ligase